MAIFICAENGEHKKESADPLMNSPAAWSATFAKNWLKLVTKEGSPLKPELIQLTTLRVIWSMAACAIDLTMHCMTFCEVRWRDPVRSSTGTLVAMVGSASAIAPATWFASHCARHAAAVAPITSPEVLTLA